MKRKLHTTFAAVHLGSEMISMQIVEYRSVDRYRVVETCNRRIRLGEATFKNKTVPFHLVEEICDILQGFKQLMEEYGVEEYILQATTAVREAKNQVFLLDQIYSRTGLVVEVVDMPKEIYTKFVTIRNTLKLNKISSNSPGMLMMDISSGGLGITMVRDEQIVYQSNFHVGVIRIKEAFERNRRENMHFNKALAEYIASMIGPVRRSLFNERANYLVLSGAETELILKLLGRDPKLPVQRIPVGEFRAFFGKVRRLSLAQLINSYNLEEDGAEIVLPTVLLYEQLLDLIPAAEIIITNDRFIDGVRLLHIGRKTNPDLQKFWENELMSLLHSIGRRYSYDVKHVQQVERLALAIFDRIGKDYGMGAWERQLLRGVAVLHDIGKFICLRSHSLYTYQLIMDTDILGFSVKDKSIIAMAAYYHANLIFDENKVTAPKIPQELVPVVAKLAAIVRLADALDRSYRNKVRSCVISLRGNEMVVQAESSADLTLESWSFEDKAAFFQEVYGLVPVLERVTR